MVTVRRRVIRTIERIKSRALVLLPALDSGKALNGL